MAEPSKAEPTASAIISFIEKLEGNSSNFYRKMAERYLEDRETFLVFAKESEKNRVLVTRTYQETITDAVEACFTFRGLNLDDYAVEPILTKDASYSDTLKMALEFEEKASKFYVAVAEQSGSLLATIPRAFKKVAEVRGNRRQKLRLLLDKIK